MASKLAAASNRLRAFELSLAGFSADEIAEELGVTQRSVLRYLAVGREELAAATLKSAALLRAESSARLAAIRDSHWAKREDPQSATVLLRAEDRVAKLWGLDAPSQVQHLLEPGQVEAVLRVAFGGALQVFGELRSWTLERLPDDQTRSELVAFMDERQGAYVAEFEQRSAAELTAGSEAA